MRLLGLWLLLAGLSQAETAEERDARAAVEKLFAGMAAHDEAMIRSAVLPDARLYAIRDTGESTSTTLDDFARRIATMKGDLLERFSATPRVLVRGKMAQVWGEYEFLRDGKFDHCGVDSVSVFKIAEGWKIAAIAYTSEKTGCKGH
jgi:hypothetical protein